MSEIIDDDGILTARIGGRSVQRIAREHRMTEAAVDEVLDQRADAMFTLKTQMRVACGSELLQSPLSPFVGVSDSPSWLWSTAAPSFAGLRNIGFAPLLCGAGKRAIGFDWNPEVF
jgi:hypothetical protein